MAQPRPMLRTRKLVRDFRGFRAVNEVNLEVAAGSDNEVGWEKPLLMKLLEVSAADGIDRRRSGITIGPKIFAEREEPVFA